MIVRYVVSGIKNIDIWPLDEVKNYLRVSHDYDDKLIGNLIDAAIESAELFTGLSLHIRQIICRINNAANIIYLNHLPILLIEGIVWMKKDEKQDITKEFDNIQYGSNIVSVPDRYLKKDLEIKYTAGYADIIPRSISQGILMHIAAMYENAGGGVILSSQIKDLYIPYRAMKI